MSEIYQEYASQNDGRLDIQPDAGLIRNVKILGLVSRNGRLYPESVLRNSISLYEGAKVNINHLVDGRVNQARDYRDRIGAIERVQFKPNLGLFADFRFNPRHPQAGQLIWDAQNAPSNVGFSHCVEATTRRENDQTVIEKIHRVLSVDLVADPATTNGLFEQQENIDTSDKKRVGEESDDKRTNDDRAIPDTEATPAETRTPDETRIPDETRTPAAEAKIAVESLEQNDESVPLFWGEKRPEAKTRLPIPLLTFQPISQPIPQPLSESSPDTKPATSPAVTRKETAKNDTSVQYTNDQRATDLEAAGPETADPGTVEQETEAQNAARLNLSDIQTRLRLIEQMAKQLSELKQLVESRLPKPDAAGRPICASSSWQQTTESQTPATTADFVRLIRS